MDDKPELAEAMEMINRWKKFNTEKQYLDLQKSEQVLVLSAVEIFSSYIQRGLVEEGNEEKYLTKAVTEAIHIALTIEQLIIDAEEESK